MLECLAPILKPLGTIFPKAKVGGGANSWRQKVETCLAGYKLEKFDTSETKNMLHGQLLKDMIDIHLGEKMQISPKQIKQNVKNYCHRSMECMAESIKNNPKRFWAFCRKKIIRTCTYCTKIFRQGFYNF